jgi:hypothetical protein
MRIGRAHANRRGLFLALAALALLLRVAIPAGYMVDSGAPGASPGLVICTGHGPLRLAPEKDGKAPAHRSADGVCAFAGHGLAAAPPLAAPVPALFAPPPADPAPARTAVRPGQGLAAPPPPPTGPPSV